MVLKETKRIHLQVIQYDAIGLQGLCTLVCCLDVVNIYCCIMKDKQLISQQIPANLVIMSTAVGWYPAMLVLGPYFCTSKFFIAVRHSESFLLK